MPEKVESCVEKIIKSGRINKRTGKPHTEAEAWAICRSVVEGLAVDEFTLELLTDCSCGKHLAHYGGHIIALDDASPCPQPEEDIPSQQPSTHPINSQPLILEQKANRMAEAKEELVLADLTPEEAAFLKNQYPLPGGAMPKKTMKIAGSELETVILVPKGATDYPIPKPASKPELPRPGEEKKLESEHMPEPIVPGVPPMMPPAGDEEERKRKQRMTELETAVQMLTQERDSLKQELLAAQNMVNELRTKFDTMQQGEKQGLAESIVKAKVARNLATEEEGKKLLAELVKHDVPALRMLSRELEHIPTGAGTPQPKIHEDADKLKLSEEQKKERELRKQMFGHEEPANEYLAKLAEKGESYLGEVG